jgi:SAM-dependent methyltransferase
MAYCNPLSTAKAEALIALMELHPGDRILDVGCGKAELLIRLAERWGASADGVDRSGPFLEEGRRRAAVRGVADRVRLHAADAGPWLEANPGPYHAAACIGSTHALGGLAPTLDRLKQVVGPGGWIAIGEGYWKSTPPKDYLDALGATESELDTHAGNIDRLARAGVIPMHAATATVDEWDDYEWGYLRGIERHVADHPEDPDAEAMLARARNWRDVVARWGRDVLGFGVYLARMPGRRAL